MPQGPNQRRFDEVMRNRTTVVVGHRLSTVRDAARIPVLDAGRIVETGTFDELATPRGRFAGPVRAEFIAVRADLPPLAVASAP